MKTLTTHLDNSTDLDLEKFDRKRLWLALDAADPAAKMQADVLNQLSRNLEKMTEEVLVEIEVNRERARLLIAEFAGLFETASVAVSVLIDFDEFFGGAEVRPPYFSVIAKRLERSLIYLCGVMWAFNVSDEMSVLDWSNLVSDISAVNSICREINCRTDTPSLKLAA
ncbi:MAG: hypothetical protein KDB23_05555 [Planctomycetales bacterium]|nr:hypothetical protein [Planctomycetales bacterium]